MSLTKSDLVAIQKIVQTTVEPLIDGLAQSTAAGFQEVHDKLNEVHTDIELLKTDVLGLYRTTSRIEILLQPTATQVSDHEKRITRLESRIV